MPPCHHLLGPVLHSLSLSASVSSSVNRVITGWDGMRGEAGFTVLRLQLLGQQRAQPCAWLLGCRPQGLCRMNGCSSMIPCYYYYHHRHQQGSPSLVLQPALVKGVAKFSKQNLLPFIWVFEKDSCQEKFMGGGGVAKPAQRNLGPTPRLGK